VRDNRARGNETLGNHASGEINGPVFLIDDERAMRESITQWLELAGLAVKNFETGAEALEGIDAHFNGVIVTDLRMAKLDGMAVLQAAREIDSELPVVLITGHGDIASAVQAMQEGAYDFIEKPFQPERLTTAITRALKTRSLVLKNRSLRARVATEAGLEKRLLGECDAIHRIRGDITKLADLNVDVLLIGETGTGKEVVARCLHDAGPRSEASFRTIDCSSIPAERIETALFGEVGDNERASPFELATGGTLLLDELVHMPVDQQAKLLRVLEEREVQRVGDHRARPFDVRLISTADETLVNALETGRFRKELYFRLNAIEICLPPLRQRGNDVSLLFEHYVYQAAETYGCDVRTLSTQDLVSLRSHNWPGNVRELRNLAERYVVYDDQPVAHLIASGESPQEPGKSNRHLVESVNEFEKSLIEQALRQSEGDTTLAAETLGLPRRTLNDKLKRHSISRAAFQANNQTD
jgi:two-component system C4-dicarboxylate transport response regulator DctD